jgi:hypothetical protein
MESSIVRNLKPVAVVWIDAIPDDVLQFKKVRFGCVLNLFAETSRRGRIAGGCWDTIVRAGGVPRWAWGADLAACEAQLELYAAPFSKGRESARQETAYRSRMEAARPSWRPLYDTVSSVTCGAFWS